MPAKRKAASKDSFATIGFEAKLLAGEGDYEGADLEDPDEYKDLSAILAVKQGDHPRWIL